MRTTCRNQSPSYPVKAVSFLLRKSVRTGNNTALTEATWNSSRYIAPYRADIYKKNTNKVTDGLDMQVYKPLHSQPRFQSKKNPGNEIVLQ